MQRPELMQRPISRIKPILGRLKYLWNFYPELSFAELVLKVTHTANQVKSDFPETTFYDIEDVAYPVGHLMYESRNLEMGIADLEKRHGGEPLPPTPIGVALLPKVDASWMQNPQMRLGQLLSNTHFLAELERKIT